MRSLYGRLVAAVGLSAQLGHPLQVAVCSHAEMACSSHVLGMAARDCCAPEAIALKGLPDAPLVPDEAVRHEIPRDQG